MANNVSTPEELWSIAPVFLVEDVVATANFYRDKMGFHYERFWGDPPAFCMVKRGSIIIMLSQTRGHTQPNALADPKREAIDAYIWIRNADHLYHELKDKRVTIARELINEPYGFREFEITDCNGYRLAFGQPLE